MEHPQSSNMYQLPPPVSVTSPHSYHQGHTSTLSHPHTPTHHMQPHDTSSESGDDKRNLHHQLQHHLQSGHSTHGLVHPTATLAQHPSSCAQQKTQLDYMHQYYGPQVCIFHFIYSILNLAILKYITEKTSHEVV